MNAPFAPAATGAAIAAGLAAATLAARSDDGTDQARVRHAIDRLSFGPTPDLLAEVADLTPEGWIEQQLDPASIGDGPVNTVLATFPSLFVTNAGRVAYAFTADFAANEVQFATFVRAVQSRRQLQEVMVGFWSDHFNTSLVKEQVALYKASEDAAFRSNALGRFADLLAISAKSPAMLIYLDNHLSAWPQPNENYGRELLEVHTVGVDGGYDEQDLVQAAWAFTGWTVDGLTREFTFLPDRHYNGELRVMGWQHEGGNGAVAVERGELLLEYLARHPATAERLARKLCQRFVADDPPEHLVASAAAVYLANDTDIAAVLRHLFASKEFWAATDSKLRRPFEMLAAAARAMGAELNAHGGAANPGANAIRDHLRRTGHAPFEWGPPDGYPDTRTHWSGTGSVLARWNAVLGLARNAVGLVQVDPGPFFPAGTTVGEAVRGLAPTMLGRQLPSRELQALLDYTELTEESDVAELSEPKRRQLLALVMNAPTAQVR